MARVKILIFSAEGCGFCQDFKARFEPQYKIWSSNNGYFPREYIDAMQEDPQTLQLIELYNVEMLPTIVVQGNNGQYYTYRGAISHAQIRDLLYRASYFNLNRRFPG